MSDTKPQDKENLEKIRLVLQDTGFNAVSLTDQQLQGALLAMTNESSENPKETSIDLAYQISTDYMNSAISRFDKMDEKIQTVFTFSIGVFAIAPTLLKTNSAEKINDHFWAGLGFLVAAGAVSIIARIGGTLTIANPEKIYKSKGFEAPPDNFKRSIIKLAADAYVENSKVLEIKHGLNVISMTLFSAALLLLVYWLVKFAL